MKRNLILFAALSTLPGLVPAEESRGLIPEDFYKEVTVEQTAITPDGGLLAYTVMTIDEEKNKRHREIWMQPLKNGAPDGEAFRFTTPTRNATSPKWSPDGRTLSFQSKRGEDENSTWFMRVSAPGGEADHIEGVEGAPSWSPDGNWIAFTKEPEDEEEEESDEESDEEGEEAEEEEKNDKQAKKKKKDERKGWVAPDAVTDTLDKKRFDGRVYTTMRMKRDGTQTLMPHRSARNKRQLYVVDAGGGEAVQITDLPFDVGGVEWTADASTLLFVGDEKQDDEYNDDYTSDIYAVSREGGEPRKLTSGLGSERGLAISPDGKRLAYLFSADRGEPTDLMVVEIASDGAFTSDARNLTADWDLGPGAPTWAGSNRTLRWSSGVSGNSHVFEATLRGGNIRQVTQGDRSLRAVSHAANARLMAYIGTDPQHPSDLYVAQADGSREKRITTLNDEWLEDVIRMPAERLTWTVDDGTEIEGWVIKPIGYSPGVRDYPMILKIHGGPHSAYGNYWFRTFHVLSNAGFFVLYTNPRGSSGYGHDFTYATRGQWGLMDSEDYLKGVDAAIAKYSDIDPDRVGVSGGSYGGFMSAWLSSTTSRFAAANPSRMICNWESWYGASDAQRLTEFEFDGQPWEVRELYRRLSPLSYVEKVVAPTLIIHSENDFRTPIADGEQWYIALKKRGVPVELVRYPRSSHGLSRTGEPWLLVDRLERIRTWFTHWLIEEKVTHRSVAEAYGGN